MENINKEEKMGPLTIGILCFIGGSVISGGTLYGINRIKQNNIEETSELVTSIGHLKDTIAQGQQQTMINLTDQDLLKDSCSTEFIESKGDLLCREMFCRMQNRGLDKGATQSECENISHISNSKHRLDTCMPYWDNTTLLSDGGFNKNSKYAICMNVFTSRE